ncbi:hypothetical protein OG559_25410 [Micromonospora sp. NBC_01405]|uniref:hypothetical protein n=1 Tax=Micromonospora sp. NBC_01405 TaxID=2903589 RepID=UPI0032479CCF
MRLLVHIAGEADLLLSSQDRSVPPSTRAERVRQRCQQLIAAVDGPEGPAAARSLLGRGTWSDELSNTELPSPLLGALTTVAAGPDLDVMVIGTDQESPRPLDTMPIAKALAKALEPGPADAGETAAVRTATPVVVPGQDEKQVVPVLARHLDDAPSYQQALVTWGSGATSLAMGALTALSEAGIPWRLVLTNDPTTYEIIDPLEQLDTDPVVGVLVRWRMFGALADLARRDPSLVRLTGPGLELVHRAVERHDRGFEARDTASLRAVLADAVVRRDGTASLAVRRYITRRYEELLDLDRADHPWAENLLSKYKPRSPIGPQRDEIVSRRLGNDPAVTASVDLPSYRWLFGPEFDSLQNIGKGSHNLSQPPARDSRFIGQYLSSYAVDGKGWQEAGLPEPPVAPADTVLAVWLAGTQTGGRGRAEGPAETVGQQLTNQLPAGVLDFFDVEEARIRAVIFGADDGKGSRPAAEADADVIRSVRNGGAGDPRGEAWVELIDLADVNQAVAEQAIESRITRETGALLLVPTGRKPVMLSLLRAMRLVGARHGIPLFVRENAKPEKREGYQDVHLWPALTGGDLPLLIAAEQALRSLELDVAWKLLAASAIGKEITGKVRRLANTFASRKPPHDDQSEAGPGWTTGLVVQRLELVEAALATETAPAQRIRLLVLAADCVNASFAAAPPKPGVSQEKAYGQFCKELEEIVRRKGTPEAWSALVLLVLRTARNRAPVTHGTGTAADAVVTKAAETLARQYHVEAAVAALLPQDVPALLREAVAAAAERRLGEPDQPGSLRRLHEEIVEQVGILIDRRRAPSAPAEGCSTRAASTILASGAGTR